MLCRTAFVASAESAAEETMAQQHIVSANEDDLKGLIQSIAQFWMLIAGVVAIRQALDFTTGRAIATVLLGWIVGIAITFLLGLVFVGLMGIGGG